VKPHSTDKNPSFSNPDVSNYLDSGAFYTLLNHSIFTHTTPTSGNSDETVLLIHGFPTSSWDWEGIREELAQVAQIEAIDMLGFGFSDKPNKRNYTIHKQARLHLEYLKVKGIRSVHILCHDYGVSVAQEILARQAQGETDIEIKSCCFLNGGLFPETHKALLIQKLLLSPLGPLLNRFLAFNKFKESFSSVFGENTKPSDSDLSDFWEILNYKGGKHLFHNLITYMRDRITHRERWLRALATSPIPLALINGSVDPVSGEHLVARYIELGCRLDSLTQLPDIGHYPQVEVPDQVSSAYIDFLRSV